MRIFIFSVGGEMNLNRGTTTVDKGRLGLEGRSGCVTSSDQEG